MSAATENVETIIRMVAEGKNNVEIGQAIGASRDAVRRAKKKHGLVSPESVTGISLEASPSSRLDRAERAAHGVQTAEDKLRDNLEIAHAKLRRADVLLKKQSDIDRFDNRILTTIESSIELLLPTTAPITRRPRIRKEGATSRDQVFVAMLSDAHGGEVVDPREAQGLVYDWDVCVRRLESWRDSLISYRDKRTYGINKLWVPTLGDMVSGDIHEELEVTNEMPLVAQTLEMARVLYDIGLDLLDYFPEVEFTVMPGNHPRLKKKQSNKMRALHSMEYVMGTAMQMLSERDPRAEGLTIDVPLDLVKVIEVQPDTRIALMHGDGVKANNFAGIPFYGLKQRQTALASMFTRLGLPQVDMLAIGHFHQFMYWEGTCDVLINGAVKGGDEYSIANYHSAPEPVQALLEYHPENKLTAIERITFPGI